MGLHSAKSQTHAHRETQDSSFGFILAGIDQGRTDCSDKSRGIWQVCWGNLPFTAIHDFCSFLLLHYRVGIFHIQYQRLVRLLIPFLPANIAAFFKQCKLFQLALSIRLCILKAQQRLFLWARSTWLTQKTLIALKTDKISCR